MSDSHGVPSSAAPLASCGLMSMVPFLEPVHLLFGLPLFLLPPIFPAVWLVPSPVIWKHLVSSLPLLLNFISPQTCPISINALLFWPGYFSLFCLISFICLLLFTFAALFLFTTLARFLLPSRPDFFYFCYLISFATLQPHFSAMLQPGYW